MWVLAVLLVVFYGAGMFLCGWLVAWEDPYTDDEPSAAPFASGRQVTDDAGFGHGPGVVGHPVAGNQAPDSPTGARQ